MALSALQLKLNTQDSQKKAGLVVSCLDAAGKKNRRKTKKKLTIFDILNVKKQQLYKIDVRN